MSDIIIPAPAQGILHALTAAGHQAYVVGGCVRDSLLGLAPHDWDICTSAVPDEVKSALAGYKIIDTGLKHGTVTVISNGEGYEVTTFRTESGYSDHRRPDSVTFVFGLADDLARRDFTMNAIAMDVDGNLQDPFCGVDDLKAGVIRCVGSPDQRFQEDALRVMRALRFAATYGFSIEEKTAEAIHENAAGLTYVSAERIQKELSRLLVGDAAVAMLREFPDVFCTFWPQLQSLVEMSQNNPWHCYGGWEHTLHAVETSPADLVLRLATLLHDIGKPSCRTTDKNGIDHFRGHPAVSRRIADEMLQALRFDNKTRERVLVLAEHHDIQIPCTDRAIRKWLNRLGPEAFLQLLEVKRADNMGQAPELVQDRLKEIAWLKERAQEIIAEEQCFSLKDLAITGKDLIAIGIPEGILIGNILRELLNEVINETIANNKEALLDWARKYYL